MKIMINIGHTYLGLEATEHTGAILQAMNGAKVYSRSWQDEKFKVQESAVTMEFAQDDAFVATPEPLVRLQKEKEYSDQRWLEAYNKNVELEKKVKQLEGQIAAVQALTE